MNLRRTTGLSLYIDDPWTAADFTVLDELTTGLWIDVEL